MVKASNGRAAVRIPVKTETAPAPAPDLDAARERLEREALCRDILRSIRIIDRSIQDIMRERSTLVGMYRIAAEAL